MKNKIIVLSFGILALALFIYNIIQFCLIINIDEIKLQTTTLPFYSYFIIRQALPLAICIICEFITIISLSKIIQDKYKTKEINMNKNKILFFIISVITGIFIVSLITLLILAITNTKSTILNYNADKFFYFLTMMNLLVLLLLIFVDSILFVIRRNHNN